MNPRSAGYVTGRATKADIVDKAFHVFAESGYEGTSLREIARRCGINHATLLHHFPKKSLLLMAVLEHRDEIQHIEPKTLEESLGLLLGIAVRNEETPGLVRLFTLLAAEASDPDHPARHYFQERGAYVRGLIADHIVLAQGRGELPTTLDAETTATNLIALWEGLQLQAPLRADVSIAGQLGAAFDALVGRPVRPILLD